MARRTLSMSDESDDFKLAEVLEARPPTSKPASARASYDGLAPLYHLVYENWEASVARQGTALASLIGEVWGAGARTVHDAAVGIGTQALGLLALGFRMT